MFPEEGEKYGIRSDPKERTWYRTPRDRFFSRMKVLRSRGLTARKAFELCLKEKQWELEARDTEYEVQKLQAEVRIVALRCS
jgi:hypothetical protein